MATTETTEPEAQHYDRVPKTYHTAWFYAKDSPYEHWQVELVSAAFAAADASVLRLADVGGGTGRFTGLLRRHMGLEPPALCVDFSQAMLDEASGVDGVDTLCLDAVGFAKSAPAASADRVLLKEVVHHVSDGELQPMFADFHRVLAEDGVCLVFTRPHANIDYPFSDAAVAVWRANQPGEDMYVDAMRAAGFRSVESVTHGFPVSIKQAEWVGMVGDRMWSTFSEAHFDEGQLAKCIKEIAEKFPADDDGNIHFEERVVLIRAAK